MYRFRLDAQEFYKTLIGSQMTSDVYEDVKVFLFGHQPPFLPYVAPHFSHISHFNLVDPR